MPAGSIFGEAKTRKNSFVNWPKSKQIRLFGSFLFAQPILIILAIAAFPQTMQFAEAFIHIARPGGTWHLLFAAFALLLLSMALFFGYLSNWVVMRKYNGAGYGSNLIYRTTHDQVRDKKIVNVRDFIALLCAAAPFLIAGFCFHNAHSRLSHYKEVLSSDHISENSVVAKASFESLTEYIIYCEYSCYLLAFAVPLIFYIWNRHRLVWLPPRKVNRNYFYIKYPMLLRREGHTCVPRFLWWILNILLVLPLLALNFIPDYYDYVARAIGPIAITALLFMQITLIIVFLGNLSRRLGFPIILAVAISVISFGLYRSGNEDLPDVLVYHIQRPQIEDTDLYLEFSRWLLEREDAINQANNDGRPYPIFNIAAQGGGIYAATASGALVDKLQDTQPQFSEHVFAISGVSGGAVGASIAHKALLLPNATDLDEVCAPQNRLSSSDENNRQAYISCVLRQDNFSASLGVTIPDILWKLIVIIAYEINKIVYDLSYDLSKVVYEFSKKNGIELIDFYAVINRSGIELKYERVAGAGRAEALECSFLRSSYLALSENANRTLFKETRFGTPCSSRNTMKSDALQKLSDELKPAQPLAQPFDSHWSAAAKRPALIFNTTWAETGMRVIHAPFKLGQISDVSVTTFDELSEMLKVNLRTVDVIGAAIESARFPAISPAQIIRSERQNNESPLWWNMVDGGYADASGASTALDVHLALNAILEHLKQKPEGDPLKDLAQKVTLKLIMLTDAPPGRDISKVKGDGIIHAITPITTMFKVIGQGAVARALDEAGRGQPDFQCEDTDWKARLLVLDQQKFPLPLGWLLAEPTSRLVEHMVGTPSNFQELKSLSKNEQESLSRNYIWQNSCTLTSIVSMIK